MKICFINPTSRRRNWGSSFLPLGIAYLARQALDLGWEVFVLDRDLMLAKNGLDLELADRRSRERLVAERPDIVGISATTPIVSDAYHCAKMVKELLPQAKVVLGGVHASVLPEQSLAECPEIDYLVRGEGELTLADILRGKPAEKIPGLCFRSQGKIVVNEDRPPLADIDSLGLPARHLLDMAEYTKKSKYLIRGVSLRGTSIFTSRGCPYSCTFCAGPLAFGRGVRFHSVPHVIREIEELVADYRIEGLYFADDMFSSRRDRALAICDELIKRGLNKKLVFAVQLKVTVADETLLLKLKEAGCIQVEYGFESGSQRILDLMNKGVKVEQNYRAAELTRKLGIRFLANIISGMPGETREDFMETVRFLERTKPDVTGFYKLILLPGSKLYLAHPPAVTNWDDCLQDDLTTNYTAMGDDEYFELFKKYSGKISLANARNYFICNFRRDKLGTLSEAVGLAAGKLARRFHK